MFPDFVIALGHTDDNITDVDDLLTTIDHNKESECTLTFDEYNHACHYPQQPFTDTTKSGDKRVAACVASQTK